ncbi:TMV resistance protein N [Vitis vinifera]|uniref:TMV resistance protein N n=2 Tax=Vitis vinifera TaxID=29760 RepID=A0A438FJ53_VITVI|nr:TMV resistance protein N [Vitis vinifera]
MNLKHSKFLTETPDFSRVTNLERVLPSSFSLLRNLEILSFEGCKGPPPSTSWWLPRRSSNFSSFVLSPLSSLSSLKTLSLSACNISDGATLYSLGFLSSLEDLDLRENNFVTLPSNISRLPHLKMLGLENCKRLQALPELPTSIRSIMARNCTSLETISNQSFGSLLMTVRLKEHIYCPINRDGLLVPALSAVIFGSRIPDWIRYQSSGSEVKAELPPNWFNSNFLGLALCVVTVPRPGLVSHADFFGLFWRSCTLFYSTSNHASSSFGVYTYPDHLKGKVESDHLWLVYVPLPRFINWRQVTHIKASFRITTLMGLNVIKECGIGPVYVNEEMNYSIFTPNESSVVLQEIHEEGPSASGCSNIEL